MEQNKYLYLNETFTEIQQCLYSVLKTKKKLKIFSKVYPNEHEKIDYNIRRLNEIYNDLIEIIENGDINSGDSEEMSE